MPPDHQAYLQWKGERFCPLGQSRSASTPLPWYGSFSPPTRWSSRATSPVWPLLKLADRYSAQRLESACRKALSYTTSPSLKSVQTILKSGQDRLPVEPPAQEEAPKPINLPEAPATTRGGSNHAEQ